jgi:hypothetical protein
MHLDLGSAPIAFRSSHRARDALQACDLLGMVSSLSFISHHGKLSTATPQPTYRFGLYGFQSPPIYTRPSPVRHEGGLRVRRWAASEVEDAVDHPRCDRHAVDQGWLELEGAHSACLTEEGRRLMAKEAH